MRFSTSRLRMDHSTDIAPDSDTFIKPTGRPTARINQEPTQPQQRAEPCTTQIEHVGRIPIWGLTGAAGLFLP